MLKIKNQHSLAWLDAYYIHIQEGCLGGLVVEAVARGKDSV